MACLSQLHIHQKAQSRRLWRSQTRRRGRFSSRHFPRWKMPKSWQGCRISCCWKIGEEFSSSVEKKKKTVESPTNKDFRTADSTRQGKKAHTGLIIRPQIPPQDFAWVTFGFLLLPSVFDQISFIRDEKTWATAERRFLINTSRAQIQS